MLLIPSLEVEEVGFGNPVAKARREEPQSGRFCLKNSNSRRKELPYKAKDRKAVDVLRLGLKVAGNGQVAPRLGPGGELFESVTA